MVGSLYSLHAHIPKYVKLGHGIPSPSISNQGRIKDSYNSNYNNVNNHTDNWVNNSVDNSQRTAQLQGANFSNVGNVVTVLGDHKVYFHGNPASNGGVDKTREVYAWICSVRFEDKQHRSLSNRRRSGIGSSEAPSLPTGSEEGVVFCIVKGVVCPSFLYPFLFRLYICGWC